MKHYKVLIISLLLMPFLLISQKNKNLYEIEGLINMDSGHIYLVHYDNAEKRIVDSSKILNNAFHFKGNINGYSKRFYIKLNPKEKQNADSLNAVQIEADPSKFKLSLTLGSFSNYKITNCKSCDELRIFEKKIKLAEYNTLYDSLLKVSDTLQKIKIEKELQKYNAYFLKEKIRYIRSYPNSNISSYLLFSVQDEFSINQQNIYDDLYRRLSEIQKNSYYGRQAKQIVDNNENVIHTIGTKGYDFVSLDKSGNKISLKDLASNSYILLDMWASWCIPCREEIPFLNTLLNTYRAKGFKIVGVSDDYNINTWEKAIKKDKTQDWIHIDFNSKLIDGKTYDRKIISSEYNVNSFPTSILIDKSGVIIGRYEEATKEELEKKLKSIFK